MNASSQRRPPMLPPTGLGATCGELDTSRAVGVWPKTKFSMYTPPVIEKLREMPMRNNIILFGIEVRPAGQRCPPPASRLLVHQPPSTSYTFNITTLGTCLRPADGA